MKNVEEMIACVAITGAVLLAPAQKMFKNAEAMVRENLRHDVQLAMALPLPPLPALHAVLPLPPPAEALTQKKSACMERDLAKVQARLARDQVHMQTSIARNLTRDQVHMQSGLIRSQAHWQAEMVRQQVRAAMVQAHWAEGRGQ